MQIHNKYRGQKTPESLNPYACADLVSAILDVDQLGQNQVHPNEVMKEAIK
jgi:hypothetical protein